MCKKLDAIKIYEIAETDNTAASVKNSTSLTGSLYSEFFLIILERNT